ncbi:MAG: DUF429 domain-containing protein [Kiritimatiellae bacterium]|nr:DUF429 domain-containing protein [Kiritimatiellia bacterium]
MTQNIVIIGIDCACQARDVGLARAEWSAGRATVTDALCGSNGLPSIPSLVAEWMCGADHCVLALDAPLGWPQAMGMRLASHTAGQAIPTEPNVIFRRETDRDIKLRFGKTPLDVGADRIARTAHAALSLLDEVRQIADQNIPLAWDTGDLRGASAIEVYPAGTLLAHGLPATGYKKPEHRQVRADILDAVGERLVLPENQEAMLDDADCLDAVLCVLAATDFLAGHAIAPSNAETARKEGWIWVRDAAAPAPSTSRSGERRASRYAAVTRH